MSDKNYIVFHLHTDWSNPFTTMDSVTKYNDYIEKAKSYGMKSIAFSEHGNVFEWYSKKRYVEKCGMKYIHAVEAYVTESIEEKKRDNYHTILIAKNYEGVKEINYLMSHEKACNRQDGHFYYNPRITFDELINTSENIIVTSACLGSILYKGNDDIKERFIKFLSDNKNRCFLEIQHHNVKEQIEYNKYLYNLHLEHNIPLIAGTDTHSLTHEYAEARIILQKSKNIHFDNEDGWDLTFKNYNELCYAYYEQGSLPQNVYLQAIDNTNLLYDMVEDFELDKSPKYPKIYDNGEEIFKKKINKAYLKHKDNKYYSNEQLKERIKEEFDVYKQTGTIDYMLLQDYCRQWEVKNGIRCGYGRGSVNGSMIAYLLKITEMDSLRFDLNFFRFMNPERVSNADIDTDYSEEDRDKVKKFLLTNDKFNSSEIVTFNTIQTKGAIKDVCRALNIPLSTAEYISKNVESKRTELECNYPQVFKYLSILKGVIVSIGTHPSGILVTDHDIQHNIGTCTLSTTKYPVAVLDMNDLDSLFYTKLDILGLKNISIINKTCDLIGIQRKNPDNTDLTNMDVWKSIRDDTTDIFQFESDSAAKYLKKFMSDETLKKAKNINPNLQMIKWFSFANGLLRPGCASYRNSVADGCFYDNGFEELNKFLSNTMGHVAMQEDIMQFLVQFCGYSMGEAGVIRKNIAKKKDKKRLEELVPEIESRFINFSSKKYNISRDKCKKIIKPFVQIILDASDYAFSWNHSDSYSCIGYILGWLRYYHPYELLTASLNVFQDDEEKTASLIKYANKIGVSVQSAKFGISKADYRFDKEQKLIVKGTKPIKYLNQKVSNKLFDLSKNSYNTFIDLLYDLQNISINSKQLDILIKLDYFRDFGGSKRLLRMVNVFNEFGKAKQYSKDKIKHEKIEEIIKSYSKETAKQYKIEDNRAIVNELCKLIPEQTLNYFEKARVQMEFLGYLEDRFSKLKDYYIIFDVSFKYKNPIVTMFNLESGKSVTIKVKIKNYKNNPFDKLDIIKVFEIKEEGRWKKDELDKWYQDNDDKEQILKRWTIRKS